MNILLGSVGITIILTQSSIFESLRNKVSKGSELLEELVNCPMCVGFWVGFVLHFVGSITGLSIEGTNPFLCFETSLVSWLAFTAANYLATKTYYYQSLIEEKENNEVQ